MVNTQRGRQSSGSNISQRHIVRPHPAVPSNGAVLTGHRTVQNGPTVPIRRTIPVHRTIPVRRTIPIHRTIPSGSTAPGSSVSQTGPTVSTGSAVAAGRSLSTDTAQASLTVTTGHAVPAHATGPTSPLLRLQAGHRSQRVIEGEYIQPMFPREHITSLPWDQRYEQYVIAAGLYGVHMIGHIPTDHALVSALVERWRQETHTFHFPVGEMTITLQDAAVLLGLRVDGQAICLRTDCNWSAVVRSLLGRVDPTTFREKSKVAINISWLRDKFSKCPAGASDIIVQRYARAYCFVLVGSVLFTDHSGDSISSIYLPLLEDFEKAGRYSWASAVLAYLYKELCLATKPDRKQFGGSITLLQLWSWERLPMGRPRTRQNTEIPQLGGDDLIRRPPLGYGWSGYHELAGHVTCRVMESYRREIDGLIDAKVTWLPYEDKMDLLPANCRPEDRLLWRTTAPLIHFWIVEMHNPSRVARQFDRYQDIPPILRDTDEVLHTKINGTGKDWPDEHAQHLRKWNVRQRLCLRDRRPYDHSRHEQYMRWFSGASILYLSSPGGVPNTNSSAERVTQIARSIVERFRDVADEDSRAFARQLLHHCWSAIKAVLEPIGNERIFAALDGEQPRWRQVAPVPDGDPGPSNRAPLKRARCSSSTCC